MSDAEQRFFREAVEHIEWSSGSELALLRNKKRRFRQVMERTEWSPGLELGILGHKKGHLTATTYHGKQCEAGARRPWQEQSRDGGSGLVLIASQS